jgi:hypothetical protein
MGKLRPESINTICARSIEVRRTRFVECQAHLCSPYVTHARPLGRSEASSQALKCYKGERQRSNKAFQQTPNLLSAIDL